ncbi:hypothetical protein [Undibacterium sp.]|uniref:ATP-binding protein n=1 Tax=Undibacterium sp. TaxID=1914977 RepID=UPI003752EEB6
MNTDASSQLKRLLDAPSFIFRVELQVPTSSELASLRSWLQDVLKFDLGEVAHSGIPTQIEDDPRERASTWVNMIVVTLREFLQLVHVPVFDPIRVVALEFNSKSSTNAVLSIAVPSINHVSSAVYRYVLEFVMETCLWACRVSPNEANKTKLFDSIAEKLKRILSSHIYSGKSTMHVLRAAHSMGIPFSHLGVGVYQLGWGSKARRIDRSITELDSFLGARLSQNKLATAALLRMAGLPAPTHQLVNKESQLVSTANKIGFPVVVKPSDRERGEGVTVDVIDLKSLQQAYQLALDISPSKQVIVERQVQGVCHRIFVANGSVLYALKRLPMLVVGDGRQTVKVLVDSEVDVQNILPPWRRSGIVPIDDLALAELRRLGLDVGNIPVKGERVSLRRIESTAWGGVDEDVSNTIHPENVSIAIRAAELFGLTVAGIDIITPDIAVPWYENGAIINEVNLSPLFGGGEISRRHIPVFLQQFMQGDGKIPIELFDGEMAMTLADARQAELLAQGFRCFTTSATRTMDHRQMALVMPLDRLEDRVRALLCRPDVDALLIICDASIKSA